MTEISRPWAGTTIGDAGPYTAKDWWDIWQFMQKANGRLTLSTLNNGVYYAGSAGKLAGSVPGANTFRISAGAAMVDGAFYYNDANVDINVPSATAGNVRNDRIVLRKSFNSAVQTVRIVRVAGGQAATPGPGTPTALVKDTTGVTYWEVPLYQVQVSDAGIVTVYADEREYIDAVREIVSVPVGSSWNYTDSVDVISATFGRPGPLLDGKSSRAHVEIIMPDHIADTLVVSAWVLGVFDVVGPTVADLALYVEWDTISDGVHADGTTHNVDDVTMVTDVWGGYRYVYALSVTGITKGCRLYMALQRDGVNPAVDTYAGTIHVLSFILSFYRWR